MLITLFKCNFLLCLKFKTYKHEYSARALSIYFSSGVILKLIS